MTYGTRFSPALLLRSTPSLGSSTPRKSDIATRVTSIGRHLPKRLPDGRSAATVDGCEGLFAALQRSTTERNPKELTTEQGYRLLDEIRSFGEPLMVFTGGDPLKRPDLLDLVRYSVKIGLRTNVPNEALPETTWRVLEMLPDVVSTGAVLLGGIWWISNRREEVAKAEGRHK